MKDSAKSEAFVEQGGRNPGRILYSGLHVIRGWFGFGDGIRRKKVPLPVRSDRRLVLHIFGKVNMSHGKHPIQKVTPLARDFLWREFGRWDRVVCILEDRGWSCGVRIQFEPKYKLLASPLYLSILHKAGRFL